MVFSVATIAASACTFADNWSSDCTATAGLKDPAATLLATVASRSPATLMPAAAALKGSIKLRCHLEMKK